MECWICGRPAHGVCRFCGRGICKDHVQEFPYVLSIFESQGVKKGLVVSDALWCGQCKPQDEPVDLKDLK